MSAAIEDLKAALDDLETYQRAHRDVLNDDPRFGWPIQEALDRARTKYRDMQAEAKHG
jgi:hypothetical protein